MKKTIYRMQDSEGRGPWRLGFSHVWTEDRPEDSDYYKMQPWPIEFSRVNFRHDRHYGCGCETLPKLRRWFSVGEYTKLVELGFMCVELTGNMITRSDTQCIIERRKPLTKFKRTVDLY